MRLSEAEFTNLIATREGASVYAGKPGPALKPKTQGLIRQTSKMPNQTESAFENEVLYWRKLRGEIERYEFEPIRLRLANGVTYTPDWCVWVEFSSGVFSLGCKLIFYEVKGEKRKGRIVARDDASVKIKIAAKQYPEFQFVLVWKDETGNWQEQEVLQ